MSRQSDRRQLKEERDLYRDAYREQVVINHLQRAELRLTLLELGKLKQLLQKFGLHTSQV